jgi:hypothetical protein
LQAEIIELTKKLAKDESYGATTPKNNQIDRMENDN